MIVVNKTAIRAPGGKILGFVEEDKKGNKQVREFSGRILGFYDKELDWTRDFSGRKVSKGDTVIGFLYKNN